MKKAKEDYDDLVARIRKGVQVPFGQMEEVFAEAFLRQFLNRLSSEAEREHALRLYQNHLAPEQDEYEEPPEMDDEKRVHYELELIRAVSSSLGVRPTVPDLSPYVQRAVRDADWDLLSRILGLSREGTVGSGTLEDLAIETLGNGDKDSYEEFKKQFPNLQVSPAQAAGAYRKLIENQRIADIRWVREETKIAVPPSVCQEGYGVLLGAGERNLGERLSWIAQLQEVTRVHPVLTPDIADQLCAYVVEHGEVPPPLLDQLAAVFPVYTDESLGARLQTAALHAGNVETFERLWRKSSSRPAESDIREGYGKAVSVLEQQGRDWRRHVAQLHDLTGVAPLPEMAQRAMDLYLNAGHFGHVLVWMDRTGYQPVFEQARVAEIAARMRGGCSVESAEQFMQVMGRSRVPADEIIVRDLTLGIYEGGKNFEGCRSFCQSHRAVVPVELAGRHIKRLVGDLNKQLQDLLFTQERSGWRDMLSPERYLNLGESKKRRREAAREWRDTATHIEWMKKEYRIEECEAGEMVQTLFAKGLEVVFADIVLESKKPLPLLMLSRVLGVYPERKTVVDSVYHTIGRFSRQRYRDNGSGIIGVYMTSRTPGALLSEASAALGWEVSLTREELAQMAERVRQGYGQPHPFSVPLKDGLEVFTMITGYNPGSGGV